MPECPNCGEIVYRTGIETGLVQVACTSTKCNYSARERENSLKYAVELDRLEAQKYGWTNVGGRLS